jgi:dihydroxyacetone kinase
MQAKERAQALSSLPLLYLTVLTAYFSEAKREAKDSKRISLMLPSLATFLHHSVRQIVSTMRQGDGAAGIVLIIKNYTGDVFHFHLAAEKARTLYGLRVETVTVDDDVSVGRKKGGKVGRRGLAGTVLVQKVVSARSSIDNKNLSEIVEMGRRVAKNLVTVRVYRSLLNGSNFLN